MLKKVYILILASVLLGITSIKAQYIGGSGAGYDSARLAASSCVYIRDTSLLFYFGGSGAGYDTTLIKKINCSFIEPRIIFVPNASKFGDTSINDLINHQAFVELIEKKNIILVLKGKPYSESKHRIFYLPPYVDETYFKALLKNSFVVLLNYPLSFNPPISDFILEGNFFFHCIGNV